MYTTILCYPLFAESLFDRCEDIIRITKSIYSQIYGVLVFSFLRNSSLKYFPKYSFLWKISIHLGMDRLYTFIFFILEGIYTLCLA